jgi:hypothetical protein
MVAVLLLACGRSAESVEESAEGYPPPGRQRLRGFFITGNELHAFQLCGRAELTWVELQGWEPGLAKLRDGFQPLCPPREGVVNTCGSGFGYVEMDATVSGPCQCGHLGKFRRKLDINEVFLGSKAPADCPCLDAHYPQ